MATRTAPATVLPFMRWGYRMRAKRDKQASNTYMSQIIIIIKCLLGIVPSLLPVGPVSPLLWQTLMAHCGLLHMKMDIGQ